MVSKYNKGDIVLVEFPYTEKTGETKKRPAMVIYSASDNDVLVCQITTNNREEKEQVYLPKGAANVKKDCYIRTHKINTLRKNSITIKIGQLPAPLMTKVNETILSWLDG